MDKRLKQGQKYKVDYTKNKILLILCEHPEGIEEPELRDIIKLQLNISDPKGIKDHLKTLEEKGFLCKKEQIGKENMWSLRTEVFSELMKKFLDKDEQDAFHVSPYCQNMIASPLLREIEKLWNIKKPYNPEKELETQHKDHLERLKKRAEAGVEGITKEEWPDILKANEVPHHTKPIYFTEEDVLEILKLSPTALKKALEGTDIKEKSHIHFEPTFQVSPNRSEAERSQLTCFQQLLLASLTLDSMTNHYPGYMFVPELSLKIFAPHKSGAPEKKSFHKKADLTTFHSIKPDNKFSNWIYYRI
ncbi:MAG: hypothetical protein WC556_00270 [Candidatus Methanoperedens sp.]